MATFSTNQVKHLYVALRTVQTTPSQPGDIKFAAAGDDQFTATYIGYDGKVRTDLIDKNTLCVKAVKADSMAQYPESATITMGDSMAVAGQQYIIKVTVNEFGGMTYEDKGFIFGEYTAVANDTNALVLANLASNLAKNAAKAAYNPLIKVYLRSGTSSVTNTEVTADIAVSSLSGSYTGILIEGAEQPWTLNKMGFDRVFFNVATDKIIKSGLETAWATVTKNTDHQSSTIKNSKKIADLEAFCWGERADIYRGVGYPNNFEFRPMVDPTNAYGYHVLELTWAYQGDAEDIQKSPKELIVVAPGASSSTYSIINSVITSLNSAAGTSVSTLS